MAGARYLTGLNDALVVDVGGTTSDIGFLDEGAVKIYPSHGKPFSARVFDEYFRET